MDVRIVVQTLPEKPGVYQFYSREGELIYVGKAKNIRKRVSSYFNKQLLNAKTRVLVSRIERIEHIVVQTESEALLLENNLIKEHQPRYNVLLKDDKTYPWICIKNERFPRIFPTRKRIRDGSQYFGPYTSMKTVRTLMDLIRSVYPLRTCTYDLAEEKVLAGKYKLCLEYHIGNCLGPCKGYQDEESYDRQIEDVRSILRGDFKTALRYFRHQMNELAAAMEFEKAQRVKEKIRVLENYRSKSTVVNPSWKELQVYSILSEPQLAYVNFLQVTHGAVTGAHTLEIRKKMDETDEELLVLGITEIRKRFGVEGKELLVPFDLELELGEGVSITVPRAGDKKKLLELSMQNARSYRMERFKQIKFTDPDRHIQRVLEQMRIDLRLSELPRHIECFDNSNIQGKSPVAACVVFRDTKPARKEYRHFHIKTVEGPNDFASMEEVVHRRYRRLLDEEADLPQLIVIDGGKGQLSSALRSLEVLGLRGRIAVIGIAKKLEEIFYPGDPIPLYLDKKSETLKIVQQLRNEAHRFGLSFHRKTRSKKLISGELEQINGIGKKTATELLRTFKSMKRIREAGKEELQQVVGASKAKIIYHALHSDDQ